ncbi:MAG: two-component regulator propeller domain-containing protein [Candidatus Rifleibacteriota bacterium]
MEKTNSRWFFIFILISLISIFFFPRTSYAETNWMKFFRKDGLLNTYKRAYATFNDKLLIGTFGEGLHIHDGDKVTKFTDKNTRTSPQRPDGLISDYITCINVDEKQGTIWIGTNAGLSSCNLEGKEWQRHTTENGLPNDVIRDIAIARDGTVWVATPMGLAQYNGETWKVHNDKNGLHQNSIHSLNVKDDSLWVGTIGGTVSRYKNGSWKTFVTFRDDDWNS